MYSTLLKNFIELYSTREGILHLSRDAVIRFEPSFFCLIALIELFKIKKKIAQIGLVDREIFAKNGIFKFCLVPGVQGQTRLWPVIYGTIFTCNIFFKISVFL